MRERKKESMYLILFMKFWFSCWVNNEASARNVASACTSTKETHQEMTADDEVMAIAAHTGILLKAGNASLESFFSKVKEAFVHVKSKPASIVTSQADPVYQVSAEFMMPSSFVILHLSSPSY